MKQPLSFRDRREFLKTGGALERALDLGVNLIDPAPRYGFPERWSDTSAGASRGYTCFPHALVACAAKRRSFLPEAFPIKASDDSEDTR